MEMTDVGPGADAKPVMVRKIYLAYFLPGREYHLDVLVDRAVKFYCMESADFAPYPELKDLGGMLFYLNFFIVLVFNINGNCPNRFYNYQPASCTPVFVRCVRKHMPPARPKPSE